MRKDRLKCYCKHETGVKAKVPLQRVIVILKHVQFITVPYSYEFNVLYTNVSGDMEAQNQMQPLEDVDEEEEPEEWMRVAQMQMMGMVDHNGANLEWYRDADWTITQLHYNKSQCIQM